MRQVSWSPANYEYTYQEELVVNLSITGLI